MIIVLGLVILVAAVVVGVGGVLANSGQTHAIPAHGFAEFGYHVTGSTGTLFLYGMVVGGIAVFGLGLLLASAHRVSRRGRGARRRLRESQRENAAINKDRDHLIVERDASHTEVAGDPSGGSLGEVPVHSHEGHRSLRHPLGSGPREPVSTSTDGARSTSSQEG